MKFANRIVAKPVSRLRDPWGSGQYGASRGSRRHRGLDIKVRPKEKVYAPIPGTIVQEAIPYANDPYYRGLLIRGDGEWQNYEIKIFYILGIKSGWASAGEQIGTAQNLGFKYPGITNHLHLEVKRQGRYIDPFELWLMCF